MVKPIVVLFSDFNFVAYSLVESLLSNSTRVAVFSRDTKSWQKKTVHLTNPLEFKIFSEESFSDFSKVNYAIFICGLVRKEEAITKFVKSYGAPELENIKSLAILPFETFSKGNISKIPLNNNLAIVYVGDLLGAGIDLTSNLLINSLLNEAFKKREVTFGVGEVVRPLLVQDLARYLIKWIFSFGPYGKETFLFGSQASTSTFWTELKKIVPGLTVSYDEDISIRVVPRGYEVKTINTSLSQALKETFIWLLKSGEKPKKIIKKPVRVIKLKTPKINFNFRKPKIALAIIIPILVFPYLCLALVACLFYFSFRSYMAGNGETARNLLLLARTPSVVGREASRILKPIPLVGAIYKESYYASEVSERLSGLGVSSIQLVDNTRYLFDKALGNEIYDPDLATSEIRTQLNIIFEEVSKIQVSTNEGVDGNLRLATYVLNRVDFEKVKKTILEASKITDNLSDILGKGERKTYLVLFQNNMELRPTGGFIGSFGLLTFESGRMSDFTLSDVYSADGQLKGHIEPPAPIKDHLGEANWFLRDSNWDPDFPTSASRAEWFLDKEIDKQVDGVIVLDLEPVKSMLMHTGPIYLADYDLDITKDNLYEKTQDEVHEDLFPGTHKKASFLTALSRNLVTEVSNLPSEKKALILKEFYKDLEERHIQISLHNTQVQDSVAALGWNGEVATPTCGSGCYADFVGVVEANVGVNKANYFIQRRHDLKIEILPKKIRRELTIELKNNANPSLGLLGKYKAYVRVLVPVNAEAHGNYDITTSGQRKELGFLAEVLGGEAQKLVISWSTPRVGNMSYGIYFRKQAGTGEDDPLNVSILAPTKSYSYNTNLSRDFLTKVTWINTP